MAYPHSDVAKTSATANVNTVSAVVVPANPSRLELTIVNGSDTDITLTFATVAGVNPTAVFGNGIVLKAGGGSYTTTSYSGPIAAIHAGTGAKVLSVNEV